MRKQHRLNGDLMTDVREHRRGSGVHKHQVGNGQRVRRGIRYYTLRCECGGKVKRGRCMSCGRMEE